MSQPLSSMNVIANRVLQECGVPVVTAFASTTSPQAQMAYSFVLDGYADIWFRNRWEWLRYEASINLVPGTDEYPLPVNFQRMAIKPWLGPIKRTGQLTEYSPEQFMDAIAPMDPTQQGQPQFFTIDHTTLKLWPVPSATLVAASPVITFQYFMEMPARLTRAQEALSLAYMPSTFEEALVLYGKSKLKQYLEFPDFDNDMKLYEMKLKTMFSRNRQTRTPATMRLPWEGVSEW